MAPFFERAGMLTCTARLRASSNTRQSERMRCVSGPFWHWYFKSSDSFSARQSRSIHLDTSKLPHHGSIHPTTASIGIPPSTPRAWFLGPAVHSRPSSCTMAKVEPRVCRGFVLELVVSLPDGITMSDRWSMHAKRM